jgi:hypothetical protein
VRSRNDGAVRGQRRHSVRVKCYRSHVVGLVLFVGMGLFVAGCFGGGEETSTAPIETTSPQPSSGTTTTSTTEDASVIENDALSTFRSKDPFIQQALGGGTTATTGGGTTSSTGPTGPGTTVYRPTSSTIPSTGTTKPGGSTTTTNVASTTTTTAPHLHTLKVLSVGQVSGAAAVTMQVDSSVYKDRRIGDVVSTSWGQIKVLDINTSSKVVTLLHGSETLNLVAGQAIYE